MKAIILGRVKHGCLCIAVAVGIALPMVVFADQYEGRRYLVRGVPVTGINELCGSPVNSLSTPEGVPPTFHVPTIGGYAPDGDEPISLSPINCGDKDIVVATNAAAGAGIPDIDPRLNNIPLREVPVITGQDGSRSTLPPPGDLPANAFPPTKSNPNDAITLGDWLSAKGIMSLRCRADGTAKVRLSFRNLIPNGVYTVWALWNTTPPGAAGPTVAPLPFGGFPNIMVPNKAGRASFVRELASCPKDITLDGSQMMSVETVYHSDGNASGILPELVNALIKVTTPDGTEFSSKLVPGAVAHDQLNFLISGERL